ncbi:MAG: hypothetical protein ABS95_02265 [Verrucomicrobia bacterium SCN 57-15]|nr:MAG: hypothetical protein ABS95_02265 [Verrucomicrobia bacterium SCN 57-15]
MFAPVEMTGVHVRLLDFMLCRNLHGLSLILQKQIVLDAVSWQEPEDAASRKIPSGTVGSPKRAPFRLRGGLARTETNRASSGDSCGGFAVSCGSVVPSWRYLQGQVETPSVSAGRRTTDRQSQTMPMLLLGPAIRLIQINGLQPGEGSLCN